ncbi:MAG: hypothetical protein NE327_11190 [Lentisphaeraceae bacterium]|nr:hypothetical protein [Lentisphaeraceae bacterium]
MHKILIIFLLVLSVHTTFAEEEVKSKYVVIFCRVGYYSGNGTSSDYRTPVIETKQQFKEFEKVRFSDNWANWVVRHIFEKKFKGSPLTLEGKIFDDARKARDYYRKAGRGKYKFKMTTEEFDAAYKKFADDVNK